ncbi:hypothetical protein C8R45DRAFT_931793 [Mycena sanguinolenta]|nr:hypothetical protein C8R45DRAFT_931793 [Mycena sanguinolenta]
MVQLSAVFITLCAVACALAGSVPAKRRTPNPQCAVTTVEGELQSSRDTIPGADALAVVNIHNNFDVALISAVANSNSIDGFTAKIGPVFDEANRLLTATNSPALQALTNAQNAAQTIATDCN